MYERAGGRKEPDPRSDEVVIVTRRHSMHVCDYQKSTIEI